MGDRWPGPRRHVRQLRPHSRVRSLLVELKPRFCDVQGKSQSFQNQSPWRFHPVLQPCWSSERHWNPVLSETPCEAWFAGHDWTNTTVSLKWYSREEDPWYCQPCCHSPGSQLGSGGRRPALNSCHPWLLRPTGRDIRAERMGSASAQDAQETASAVLNADLNPKPLSRMGSVADWCALRRWPKTVPIPLRIPKSCPAAWWADW